MKQPRTPVYLVIIVAAAALLGATACKVQSRLDAPAGAVPVTSVPVGPLPGAGPNVAEPANPYAGDMTAAAQGRQLFVRMNCAGCHGGHAGGGMGPSLRDPEWIYGSSDAKIFNSIAEGRAHGMPAWGTKLPEDYIWKMTAYIKMLGTRNEPDPPQ
jgi:cytochrome c oxidase cbb3-type subunit 3